MESTLAAGASVGVAPESTRAGACRVAGAPFGPWAGVADRDWNDWRWQLRERLRSPAELSRALGLGGDDAAWLAGGGAFEVGVTPYFASLCTPGDLACPLRRQVVPDAREAIVAASDRADPLGEDRHRTAPGVVHKYPDRVLLLVTDTCAAYCRYCTRARWVATGDGNLGGEDLDAAIGYIAAHAEIRDVLVSGGDPLLWSSSRLHALIDRLTALPHLRLVRIGTRVPIFLPMRVDAELCRALAPRRIPVFVNVHCNHARELAPPTVRALAALADAGIPLGGQTVLLRGINDDPMVLCDTWYAMLAARVRPYYLFHCDPVRGSGHLRTSVERGLSIMRDVIGTCSGMAVPKYCIDLEGGGKIPLWPDFVVKRDGDQLYVRGVDGQVHPFWAGDV